jgi:hypothetical protein
MDILADILLNSNLDRWATPLRGNESSTTPSAENTDPNSSGLGASPAEDEAKPPAETPPTNSSTASSQSSQDSEETVPPEEPKETKQQQHRADNGDSKTGGSTGDRAAAKPTTSQPTAGTAEASSSEEDNTTQQDVASGTKDGGNKPASRVTHHKPPTGPRISPRTGAPDAGSSAHCCQYNAENNLGPHEPGYHVMEEDPKLQALCKADILLCKVYGDTIHRNDGTHLDG